MAWACENCGPLAPRENPLHGDDGVYHCVRIECDAVVRWVSEDEPPTHFGWREQQRRKLAKMKSAKTKKRTSKMSQQTDRTAKCGMCGEVKYLLKCLGAAADWRCTKCFRVENPYERKKPATRRKDAPSRVKPEPSKRPKTLKRKAATHDDAEPDDTEPDDTEPDDITKEVRAMEACARALDGLDSKAVVRVLRYVADRHPWAREQLSEHPAASTPLLA